MVYQWELDKVKGWTVNEIKNCSWMASFGQPVPGCVSVDALRAELINRGYEPVGYHNT